MSTKNGLKAEIKLMKEQMVSKKLLLVRQSRLPWCWKSSHHWKSLGKQLFTLSAALSR